MGGRLSVPRSPDGINEISRPTASRPGRIITMRTLTAPIAAVTMATLLFFYARTSVQAAKLNAQKHREADGGQLSWHKESLRRHGAIDKVETDTANLRQALLADIGRGKDKAKAEEEVDKIMADTTERYSKGETELRELLGKTDETGKKRK